ncbi:MAG TPA: hypothetical protein VFU34_08430, partial [Gaiellaceae bacterium]|nr:hypothetical protein [Gaiellaceae bacterium]
ASYNLALVYEKVDPKAAIAQWERYIELASPLATEKDWVDVARQHLRKLKSQIKEESPHRASHTSWGPGLGTGSALNLCRAASTPRVS